MEQRLLFGRAQHQIMMIVADGQVDRSVVSPRDLGHAEILEIVILGPLDIRRRKRDIAELEDFRIEFALHHFLPVPPLSGAELCFSSARLKRLAMRPIVAPQSPPT